MPGRKRPRRDPIQHRTSVEIGQRFRVADELSVLALRETQPLAQPIRVVPSPDREGREAHHRRQSRSGGALQPPEFTDAAGDPLQQAGRTQRRHHVRTAGGRQQLQELRAHALAGEPVQTVPRGHTGGKRRRIGRPGAETRLEPEEAQDPQGVLANAGRRIADEAHPPGFEIGQAAHRIVRRSVRTERERVDREVPALGIAEEVRAEADDGVPSVGLDVLAQGCDLDRPVFGHQGDRPVLDPGRYRLEAARPLRRMHHRLGQQGGRHIDVGGLHAEQRVAYAAADQAGLGTGGIQGREHAAHARAVEQGHETDLVERAVHRNPPGTRRPFSMWVGT